MKKYRVENYLSGNTHLHLVDGNTKVGHGIYCLNTLAGDKPLEKKDGTKLINISGTCDGCCSLCKKKCYAIRNQIFRSTEDNLIGWSDNTILAKELPDRLFGELQNFLDDSIVSAVRYHSFGEIPSEDYLDRMIYTANKNEFVQFYTYTKRYMWIEDRAKDIPSNLVISASIWHKNYDNPYGFAEFIYDDGTDPEVAKLPHCPAVDKNGHETGITCAKCKRCLLAKPGQKTAIYEH